MNAALLPSSSVASVAASGRAAAISARGITKSYGATRALDGIDLEVPQGSVFGLIGQNGAGKTTFIKVMLAIVRASAGQVTLLGGDPEDVRIRRRVGYLPENLQLPVGLTAPAFLRSVGRYKGLTAAHLDAAVPELLTCCGLEPAAWSRPTQAFSKGMRQRTGLAAALLGEPELLVLDEPTDGIDPLGRAQVREVIRAAVARGATVFLNSHLLAETERICDQVAIVHRGRVVRAGAMAALRGSNAWRVRFVPRDDGAALAQTAGFTVSPDAAPGLCDFAGADPAELSAALARALAAGLHVIDVTAHLRDLETLLAEAVALEHGAGR